MFNGINFFKKDDNHLNSFLADATIVSNDVANLADIFDIDDNEKVDAENPTLKFDPPKQIPKHKTTDKATLWDVIIAKIVGAYKLINDVNTSQGQLGLALLKNLIDDSTKLILYKTKDNVLSTLPLTKATTIYWKPPYLQYRDGQNNFWSILFTSDSDSMALRSALADVCTIDSSDVTKNETMSNKAINDNSVISIVTPTEEIETDKNDEIIKPKCDVVYRVAKIGHQLPRLKPATGTDDDNDSILSSDTDRIQSTNPIKATHNIPEKILSLHLPPKPTNISLSSPIWSSYSNLDSISFAAENRIQNSEIRMNLSKLDTKLDRVLDNVDRLWLVSSKQGNTQDKEEEIIALEEKVLELKKENRLLKLQYNESRKVVNTVDNNTNNEEMINLQKCNEEKATQILELTDKVKELEHDIRIEKVLNENKFDQLIQTHSDEMATLREELDKKNTEIKAFEQKIKECLEREMEMKKKIGAEKEKEKEKETETEKEKKKEKETEKEEDKGKPNESNAEMIRSIMNQFYVKLYQSIEGKNTLTSAEVLKLTAEIIRKETKAALNSN